MQWALDIVVIALLGVTIFFAARLERALGVLKRDRTSLEALVAGFNASTSSAEQGVERLRSAAEGTGRQIAAQTTQAAALRDELAALVARGERLADRIERANRRPPPVAASPPPPAAPMRESRWETAAAAPPSELLPRPRSQAERDLLAALRTPR